MLPVLFVPTAVFPSPESNRPPLRVVKGMTTIMTHFTETIPPFDGGKKEPCEKRPKVRLSVLTLAVCLLTLTACGENTPSASLPEQNASSEAFSAESFGETESSAVSEPEESRPADEFPEVVDPEINIPTFTETPETFPEDLPESEGLTYVLNADGNSYKVMYVGACTDSTIRIPAYHEDGKPITVIGDGAFHSATAVTGVYLPDTVTLIKRGAFYNCKNLKWIRIPDHATLEEYVFVGCIALKSITLPSTMTVLENDLLRDCRSLTQVILPQGLRTIEHFAFTNCESLKRINLPEGLQSIGTSAFQRSGLTFIAFPDSVTSIENRVLMGCEALEAVQLPAGLQLLSDQSFEGCTALSAVALPETLRSMGHRVFKSCSSLTSIRIPDSVTQVGVGAFENCTALKAIELSENLTQLPQFFMDACTSVEKIHIPEKVKTIGSDAFHGCTSLKELYAKGVEILESQAFAYCDVLEAVSLGKNLRSMDGAFKSSPNVVIYYDGTMAEWNAIEAVDLYDGKYSDSARIICTDGNIPIP